MYELQCRTLAVRARTPTAAFAERNEIVVHLHIAGQRCKRRCEDVIAHCKTQTTAYTYSMWIPASLTTFAQRLTSLSSRARNCSGVVVRGSTASVVKRSRTSGELTALTIAARS